MSLTSKDLKWLRFCAKGAEIFSTCSRRQYFAIIVDRHGHVLATGYNGGPRGMAHCKDGGCPRARSDVEPGSDYSNCIAIHAEANAHLHSDYTAKQAGGGTLYVNGTPCYDCAKLTANSGLERVVYLHDYPRSSGIDFLTDLGIECVGVNPTVILDEKVGWAYWLEDHWHLCKDEPKAHEHRRPVYVEAA